MKNFNLLNVQFKRNSVIARFTNSNTMFKESFRSARLSWKVGTARHSSGRMRAFIQNTTKYGAENRWEDNTLRLIWP